jgi:GntR family transcriptional regulator
MSIDPNSPVPVYLQIVDYIRRGVAAGLYRPDELIPSQRALAMQLTVNPNTVQRAYEVLEREGLVRARKGVGMYVTKQGVTSAQSKAEEMLCSAFVQAMRAALAARIPAERVRAGFEKAWQEVVSNRSENETREKEQP